MNARALYRRWAKKGIRFGGAIVYVNGALPPGWSPRKWHQTAEGIRWFREFRCYERGLRIAITLASMRRTGEIHCCKKTASFNDGTKQAGIRVFGWRIRRRYTGQRH